MDYRKNYLTIISSIKKQNRKKGNGIYYEKHHILPVSLFPNWKNRHTNMVLLTAREHYLCHYLLWKIYQNEKMLYAFFIMNSCNKSIILNSKMYEKLKIEYSKNVSENNKGNKHAVGYKNTLGKHWNLTEETRKKMSIAKKNMSEATRKKYSETLKGYKQTEEHKKKKSEAMKIYYQKNENKIKTSETLKLYYQQKRENTEKIA
jgi:hypothetical protein